MAHALRPETLRRISSSARQVLKTIGSNTVAHCDNTAVDDSYTLPDPQPITAELIAKGIKYAAAEQLSTAYLRSALDLKTEYEKQIQIASRSLTRAGAGLHDSGSLRSAYTTLFDNTLRRWVDMVVARLEDHVRKRTSRGQAPQTGMHDKRSTFKNALPALENAFAVSAYPSTQEKMRLATDTGIELKQVHIWFQNRRSRSKKEDKDARQSSFLNPAQSQHPAPPTESECCSTGSAAAVSTMLHTHLTIVPPVVSNDHPYFSIKAPPHAYPSTYPPTCDYEPFPIFPPMSTEGATQMSQWPRRASSPGPRISTITDVNELTRLFDGLSLGVSPSSPPSSASSVSQRLSIGTRPHRMMRCDFGVFASPAPLPSLIRSATHSRQSSGFLSDYAIPKPNAVCSSSLLLPEQQMSYITLHASPRSRLQKRRDIGSLSRLYDDDDDYDRPSRYCGHPYATPKQRRARRRSASAGSDFSLRSDDYASSSFSSDDSLLRTPSSVPTALPDPEKQCFGSQPIPGSRISRIYPTFEPICSIQVH